MTTLLNAAHQIVRTTRSSRYFMMSDRFAQQWAKVIGVQNSAEKVAGSDLATALDTLAEQGWDETQFAQLLHLTDVQNASDFLAQPKSLDLASALMVEIAIITLSGAKRLGKSAQPWLTEWRDAMHKQIVQQVDQCAISENFTPEPMTFQQAVEAYLNRFEHTSGLYLAVVGTYPFSENCALDELLAVMRFFNPLYRLVQDVRVDLSENINTGLFAFASENQLSIGAAKQQIQPSVIQERLRTYSDQMMAGWFSIAEYSPMIQEFCTGLLAVAEQLRTPWKGDSSG